MTPPLVRGQDEHLAEPGTDLVWVGIETVDSGVAHHRIVGVATDGLHLVSGEGSESIRFWNPSTLPLILVLLPHPPSSLISIFLSLLDLVPVIRMPFTRSETYTK